MKNKFYLMSIFLIITFNVSSQNYVYVGGEKYEATNEWEFKWNAQFWIGNPKIMIAKDSRKAKIMISVNVPSNDWYIKGDLLVFLKDGSVIKCFDRGVKDYVDDMSIAVYNFTEKEIEMLKKHLISKIRFSISGGVDKFKSYTINNQKPGVRLYNDNSPDYNLTNKEITMLFY